MSDPEYGRIYGVVEYYPKKEDCKGKDRTGSCECAGCEAWEMSNLEVAMTRSGGDD